MIKYYYSCFFVKKQAMVLGTYYYDDHEPYFTEDQAWFRNRRLHREGGPAVVWRREGTKFFYIDGELENYDSISR